MVNNHGVKAKLSSRGEKEKSGRALLLLPLFFFFLSLSTGSSSRLQALMPCRPISKLMVLMAPLINHTINHLQGDIDVVPAAPLPPPSSPQ